YPDRFQTVARRRRRKDVSRNTDDLVTAFPISVSISVVISVPFPVPVPFSFSFLFPLPLMTLFNMMYVDSDTPIGRSTNQLTDRRAAGSCCGVLVAQRNRSGR